jgi:3-phosphoshikimate 1-carboxyvinyltransferase
MTRRMLAQWAAADSWRRDAPRVYPVEPDATAASYFLALPLAVPQTRVLVRGLRDGGLQGDLAFTDVLRKLGVEIKKTSDGFCAGAQPPPRPPVYSFDFNAISDTFLTLAALAPLLPAPVNIRGVAHARRQETDRLLAAATELERLGQRVAPSAAELRADTALGEITIFPDRAAMRRACAAAPVLIETYDDHRFAMSFAILGSHDLHGDCRPWLAIANPACCAKTFPNFFNVLEGKTPSPPKGTPER